ncbi:MAG: DNA repair protein RadC [candidate division FCPU426 bacterium]
METKDQGGHRSRLRERFVAGGFEGFAEHERLELLLTLAIPRSDVKDQAKALLKRFGSLRGVFDAPLDELSKMSGMGSVAPVALKIIRSAAEAYLQEKAAVREQFLDLEDVSDFWRMKLGGLTHEEFHVAYLDSSHRLLKNGTEALEMGVPDRAVVYPRKVIESALRRGAVALIFAHNHPSGEAKPSKEDKELTRALSTAAYTLQMRVLDHLIVTADEVFSFRKEGLL